MNMNYFLNKVNIPLANMLFTYFFCTCTHDSESLVFLVYSEKSSIHETTNSSATTVVIEMWEERTCSPKRFQLRENNNLLR